MHLSRWICRWVIDWRLDEEQKNNDNNKLLRIRAVIGCWQFTKFFGFLIDAKVKDACDRVEEPQSNEVTLWVVG